MRIGIIGPGALGCLFASRLFLTLDKQDTILLIDHRNARAESLNQQGILYESVTDRQQLAIPVSSSPADVGSFDVLFSCVKSYDLDKSLQFVRPLLSPTTLLIFLQNGINHLKYGNKAPQAIPVFATSSEGATRLASGHIRHAGSGQTYLGFLVPQEKPTCKRLEVVQALLDQAGISCALSNDIRSRMWAKLFINVGINALTAIYNLPNGKLLTSETALKTLKELVREAEQVARTSGITIQEDPIAATLTVCKRTEQNISSMLQDVRNHRPTEIEAINGAITRLGRKHGIATPLNDAIIFQIKTIEQKYVTIQRS